MIYRWSTTLYYHYTAGYGDTDDTDFSAQTYKNDTQQERLICASDVWKTHLYDILACEPEQQHTLRPNSEAASFKGCEGPTERC